MKLEAKVKHARVSKYVEVLVTRGDGVATPVRDVLQIWSFEGKLIAERDPLKDFEKPKPKLGPEGEGISIRIEGRDIDTVLWVDKCEVDYRHTKINIDDGTMGDLSIIISAERYVLRPARNANEVAK